ncbi:hypothetical protein PENTCL1PPCAC_25615, partial [Pristionchus entomophagus]
SQSYSYYHPLFSPWVISGVNRVATRTSRLLNANRRHWNAGNTCARSRDTMSQTSSLVAAASVWRQLRPDCPMRAAIRLSQCASNWEGRASVMCATTNISAIPPPALHFSCSYPLCLSLSYYRLRCSP